MGYTKHFKTGKIRLLYLVLIIAVSVSVVSFIIFRELYFASVKTQGEWLSDTAKSQARLIEAVGRFDKKHSKYDFPGGAAAATLAQIIDAHEHYKGFCNTGEFVLARRIGNKIVFLMCHRHDALDNPKPIPFSSNLAEPIKRAVLGQSGTYIGVDYRGVEVLAAYEPVHDLNMGIVAKVDLDEIRQPFIKAGIKATMLAIIVIVIGSSLFIRITNPLINNLEKNESRIRSILENAAEGIIIINKEGMIDSTNRAAEQMFGYSKAELENASIGFIIPSLIKTKRNKNQIDNSGNNINWIDDRDKETFGMINNGSRFPIKLSVSKAQFRDRWIFTIIVEDITERKNIEMQLFAQRKNLERTVEERTKELRNSLETLTEANLRLEEANLAKARFLSSMSHELRTPLNAILGFCDLMHGQYFGELNEKQIEYVLQIDTSGKHLLSLINDLLDMAKIDAGAIELELENVYAIDFINTTVSMMKTQFKKKDITVDTFVADDLPPILADSRKIKQIMLNLLSNAVKYTPKNGIVTVKAIKDEYSQMEVTVSDNGIGIKADEIEEVFSEFHQADHVRDEQLGGTGIGLALTRRLVELHKGEIGVESVIGEGSSFWFTLPINDIDYHVKIKDGTHVLATTKYLKDFCILVAEDNEVNLSMILDILSVHNHKVVVARNGKEAVEQTILHKPELVFMDIRMPVLNGLEATAQIRAIPEFAKTPIIALTASTGSAAEERQVVAGCTAHVAKPIQSEDLFKIITHYLG